jgi:hypothetical protein
MRASANQTVSWVLYAAAVLAVHGQGGGGCGDLGGSPHRILGAAVRGVLSGTSSEQFTAPLLGSTAGRGSVRTDA